MYSRFERRTWSDGDGEEEKIKVTTKKTFTHLRLEAVLSQGCDQILQPVKEKHVKTVLILLSITWCGPQHRQQGSQVKEGRLQVDCHQHHRHRQADRHRHADCHGQADHH